MTYLHILSLRTGDQRRVDRPEMLAPAFAIIRAWLRDAIHSGARTPLPVVPLAKTGYTASASPHDSGGLLVTLYAPTGDALLTLAIAHRSRHSAGLWAMIKAQHAEQIHRTMTQPPRPPWCALVEWPALPDYPDFRAWLPNLADAIAWSWCARRSTEDFIGLSEKIS